VNIKPFNYTKIIIVAIILFIAFAIIDMFITLNMIYAFISESSNDELSHISINIYSALTALLISVIFLLIFLKLNHFSLLPGSKTEDQNAAMKSELEKQNKLINNLTNLYNNALEYDSLKTELFSNISHELKTPLAVILGAIQLIEQKKNSPAEQAVPEKQFQIIKRNCYRLLRLINNVLDMTRIDSGYLKLNLVNCNLVYLVEEITQSVLPYAEQKNISLRFDTDIEEVTTAVDIDKLERILLNLLSNAIKFTEPGGKISVKVAVKTGKSYISVRDNGIGIPSDMQDIIFERYRQVNSSLARKSEGSGIGLSLVKSFIELHDGTVRLNSEIGKGSEFIIELPIKLCGESLEDDCSMPGVQGKIMEAINIEFSHIYSFGLKATRTQD